MLHRAGQPGAEVALGEEREDRDAARAQHPRPGAQDAPPVLEGGVGQQRDREDGVEVARQALLVGPPAGDDRQRAELVGAEPHGIAVDVAGVDGGVRQRGAQHAGQAAVVAPEVGDRPAPCQPGVAMLPQQGVDRGELARPGAEVGAGLDSLEAGEDDVARGDRPIDAPQHLGLAEGRGVRAGGTVAPLAGPLHAGGADQRHELRRGLAQALAAAGVEVVGEGHELAEQGGVEAVARLLEDLAVSANDGEVRRPALRVEVGAQPPGGDAADARGKVRGSQARRPGHLVVGQAQLVLVQEAEQGHHVQRVAVLQGRHDGEIEAGHLAEPAQVVDQPVPAGAVPQVLVELAVSVDAQRQVEAAEAGRELFEVGAPMLAVRRQAHEQARRQAARDQRVEQPPGAVDEEGLASHQRQQCIVAGAAGDHVRHGVDVLEPRRAALGREPQPPPRLPCGRGLGGRRRPAGGPGGVERIGGDARAEQRVAAAAFQAADVAQLEDEPVRPALEAVAAPGALPLQLLDGEPATELPVGGVAEQPAARAARRLALPAEAAALGLLTARHRRAHFHELAGVPEVVERVPVDATHTAVDGQGRRDVAAEGRPTVGADGEGGPRNDASGLRHHGLLPARTARAIRPLPPRGRDSPPPRCSAQPAVCWPTTMVHRGRVGALDASPYFRWAVPS